MNSELFDQYAKHPTIELRNKIVEENLYMVDILIRKYLGKGVDYDDLYQVGALALVSAVERFDPSKGYEFKSFATPTILGEIKKYFRDKQWSLKVPRRLKEITSKVYEVKSDLASKLGRAPSIEEIAEVTGYSREQIMQSLESSKAYGTYSLESAGASEENEDNPLEQYIGFEDAGYEPYEKKLLGITAMSQALGRKKFEELLGGLVYKPPGKPVLVPESDKRPAMNTAINDFKENEEDNNYGKDRK